jgi:hypothetical protein
MDNLDVPCMKLGQDLEAQSEDAITKALGVLEEQGLYAFFLFLRVNGHSVILDKCEKFLQDYAGLAGQGDRYANLRTLAENLDNLLLARDLLHQSLVYARYHAKAKGAPA